MKRLFKLLVTKEENLEIRETLKKEGYKEIKHLGNIKWKQFQEPHQLRVIEEALELTDKADKLYEFIKNNSIFRSLDIEEQTRLRQQEESMCYYLTILVERISNFK